jgi:hypothetical protein
MEVLYQLSYLGEAMRRADLKAWHELASLEAAASGVAAASSGSDGSRLS